MVIKPNSVLTFAAGLQSATDITGHALTTNGFGDGKIAYGLFAQWQPTYLGGGAYSVLYYDQPAVPQQPSASQGISFSAVQNLNATYGLFLRANNASGNATPIETSVAFGGIMNNPFGRNRLDQAGLGLDWNKTNQSNVGGPARSAEWGAELYYNYTVFKAMQLTPDMQVYVNPVFAPNTSVAAMFTLRVTFKAF
jgi:Carbohydrate-selective porin, OprB family